MTQQRQNGYWGDPNVPQTGWVLDQVIDLGSPDDVCEMCQVQEIRYIHFMDHPKYPLRLHVGCICAGNMSGNPNHHLSIESLLRKKAGQKKKWSSLAAWKISRQGNWYIKKGDVLIVRYQSRYEHWSFSINGNRSDQWFDTLQEVEDATFEAYWSTTNPDPFRKSTPIEQPVFTYDPKQFVVPKSEGHLV